MSEHNLFPAYVKRVAAITVVSLLLVGCVTPANSNSTNYSGNNPQSTCRGLGINEDSPSWNDCLIKMAQTDAEAQNAQKAERCIQARRDAANNPAMGWAAGIQQMNVNLVCQQ